VIDAMAKIDRLKEEIGWLKVVFAIFVAIDASLVGWLAQSYWSASPWLIASGIGAASAMTFAVARVNRVAYRRINELEEV
jgi:hypothetical protein